jgi:AraC-like DNA-binding protein
VSETARQKRERIRQQADPGFRPDDIRVGPALPIPEVLREFGVDPGPVLASAGLDERLLENPENRVSFEVVARLLHGAIAATDCPHLGLHIGRQFSPTTMGAVFQLMKHSGSLRDALRALVLHLHVHDRGGVCFVVHPGPGEVGVVYGIYHRGEIDVAPFYDVAVTIMFFALRELCGPRWQPLRITFPHRRPASLAPYRRLFGAPLVFDAEHASVVFPDHWLDEPLQGADPAVQAAIEQLVREKEAAEALAFTDRVRRVLRSMVLAGTATADQVSFMFAMSRRSMHRQLAPEGTSLRLLAAETRFEVARQLLNESDMPAGEIAAVLHYADSSAFSRAFKEWSGTSPREWRQAVRKASAGPAAQRHPAAGRARRTGR